MSASALDDGAQVSHRQSLTPSLFAGPQSLQEESRAIVQRKLHLHAGQTGWLLIFLDQPKNLRTYPRGPTPPVRACDSNPLASTVLFYAALLIKKSLLYISPFQCFLVWHVPCRQSPGEEGKFDPDLSSVSSRSSWTCPLPVNRYWPCAGAEQGAQAHGGVLLPAGEAPHIGWWTPSDS